MALAKLWDRMTSEAVGKFCARVNAVEQPVPYLHNLESLKLALEVQKRARLPRDPDILNVDQVADYLRISSSLVYKLARRGKLPRVKWGSLKRIWFSRRAIDKWMMRRC